MVISYNAIKLLHCKSINAISMKTSKTYLRLVPEFLTWE